MKILLVGAHGTGKTTLAKEVQKLFPYCEIIDGIHREAKQDGFQINQTNDVISQIETVRRYLQKTQEKWDFISVDSIIRQTAYAVCNKLPEPVIGLMKELCLIEGRFADSHVFYIPIEFPLEKDDVRDEDLQFQKKIDKEIKNLLIHFYPYPMHPDFIRPALTGSVEQRINKICEYFWYRDEITEYLIKKSGFDSDSKMRKS